MRAKAVIQAQSAIHKEALEAAAGSWDGEKVEGAGLVLGPMY